MLRGTAGQWRGDLAIRLIEYTQFLAFRICGSRSTERAYWHIYFFLWDVEIDRVWVEPWQKYVSLAGLQLQRITHNETMMVVIVG